MRAGAACRAGVMAIASAGRNARSPLRRAPERRRPQLRRRPASQISASAASAAADRWPAAPARGRRQRKPASTARHSRTASRGHARARPARARAAQERPCRRRARAARRARRRWRRAGRRAKAVGEKRPMPRDDGRARMVAGSAEAGRSRAGHALSHRERRRRRTGPRVGLPQQMGRGGRGRHGERRGQGVGRRRAAPPRSRWRSDRRSCRWPDRTDGDGVRRHRNGSRGRSGGDRDVDGIESLDHPVGGEGSGIPTRHGLPSDRARRPPSRQAARARWRSRPRAAARPRDR